MFPKGPMLQGACDKAGKIAAQLKKNDTPKIDSVVIRVPPIGYNRQPRHM